MWCSPIVKAIKNQIGNLNSVKLFQEYLAYLSEYGLKIYNIDFIISYLNRYENQLTDEDYINFLTITFIYGSRNDKKSESKDISSINTQITAIANKLFKTETMFYFENQYVDDKGRSFKLKYYSSLIMDTEAQSFSYKILPKNRTNSSQVIDMGTSIPNSIISDEQEFLTTNSNINEENLFENSKSIENEKLQRNYYEIAKKYFIYNQYYDRVPGLTQTNEILIDKFVELQNNTFNLLKFREEYANFLIDMTMILHQLELLYKTNYECDKSGILIDIAVFQNKLAIINVEKKNFIQEINDDKKTYYIDNLTLMKGKTLETLGGWNVIYIMYDIWNIENDTREKKERDIKRRIDEMNQKIDIEKGSKEKQ